MQMLELAEKAFAVTEEDEGTGGIIFAKHAIVARREGANEYAGGEFDYVRARRAAWADHCAETKMVPASLMIEHGWHFECSGCGHRIDSDFLWERDLELSDVKGFQHTMVYCTPRCEARDNLERAEAKHIETRWIRRLRKFVKRKFPDAVLLDGGHAYSAYRNGRRAIEQASVAFEFPGQVHGPASLRIDTKTEWPRGGPSISKRHKPAWSCCTGDKAVFEAWAKDQVAARAGGQA